MRKKTQAVAFLSLAAPVLAAQAQTAQSGVATPPPTAPPSGIEQTIKDIKHPVPWLNWGTDLRVRNEYFDNILSLTPDPARSRVNGPLHEQDYFRFR
ncbi:MAG TPA: hypothetical protein VNZ22_04545, partial [Bacillota bacterium]|nr:hypothetical protein [Bacillota bacterium]